MTHRCLVLHPGEMGSSIAAALIDTGCEVSWSSQNRSELTRQRAERVGLREAKSMTDALSDADIVFSICPPEFASEMARDVCNGGFAGIYVDCNAISPQRSRDVGSTFGSQYVDGGIIGPPAWRSGATRLYLSGKHAERISDLFSNSMVDAKVVDDQVGSASALKMCYAAYTKGTSALLLAIRAMARSEGVTGHLLAEWEISQPGVQRRSEGSARGSAPKAWRFSGEMLEIAKSLSDNGLPSGFHEAAASVYSRLKRFKDAREVDFEEVMHELLKNPSR